MFPHSQPWGREKPFKFTLKRKKERTFPGAFHKLYYMAYWPEMVMYPLLNQFSRPTHF